MTYHYLRQGGYAIVVVSLLATLRKKFRTVLHEIFGEGWQRMIKFWWRCVSRIRIRIRIATLVRYEYLRCPCASTVVVTVVLEMLLFKLLIHVQSWQGRNVVTTNPRQVSTIFQTDYIVGTGTFVMF